MACILRERRVNGIAEGQINSLGVGMQLQRQIGGVTAVTNAIHSSGLFTTPRPGKHATYVQLTIDGRKAATYQARGKIRNGKLHHASLFLTVDRLVRYQEDAAIAVR